jgi:hypothetical protein
MLNYPDPLVSSFADDPDMAELVREFTAALPLTVGDLETMWESGQHAELLRRVHQLKGSGGGYGFDDITRQAGVTEAALRTSAPDAADELAALISLCRSVRGYQSQGGAAIGAYRKSA